MNRPGASADTRCADRTIPAAAVSIGRVRQNGCRQDYFAAIGFGVGSAILLSVLRSV